MSEFDRSHKLGFGMMRLPQTDEKDPKSIDQDAVNAMADAFIKAGGTYFDTAYPYHDGFSEVATRKAVIERYPRESFTLADKLPMWEIKKTEDMQRIFDTQIERTGVEYFDYYMLHALDQNHYKTAITHDSFGFISKLKADGKIKKIGFSFHDKVELLDQILTEHPEVDFVQLQLNYADWENENVQSRKIYECATAHGVPVVVMEPIKGGSLAKLPDAAEKILQEAAPGKSTASWALRYVASLENTFIILSGMSNFEQMNDNIDSLIATFAPISAEDQGVIDKVTELFLESIKVPCTACNYCVPDCPKHIPIPEYFALYNKAKSGAIPYNKEDYDKLAEGRGKASECVACKKCEGHCPQHIEIINWLKEVAKDYEPAE
ncbi:MAG: aldo/keto reductase [Clostridiales Family XIII bacterium]|jgi:predicted aldo/keto reductase-like oxidoreductase|nr:aldo/keto reductase [Clostridiales Family XIII bacterium]